MARTALKDEKAGPAGGAPPRAPRPPRVRAARSGAAARSDGALPVRRELPSPSAGPPAASRAFTAIELMVVIAIILILVGMLVPTISGIRGRARKQTAETRLKGISIALDRHFLDRGFYPPDTGRFAAFSAYDSMQLGNDKCQDSDTSTDDPFSLYRYLCGPEGRGVHDPASGRTYGPYIQFDEDELRDESTADDPARKIALDPWGRPWVYEEHRSIGKLTPARRLSDFPNWRAHNRDRYDIYSVGPDGVLDSGTTGGMHNGLDDDDDDLIDEADEAKCDGRDNDGDGKTDNGGEVGDDITNW